MLPCCWYGVVCLLQGLAETVLVLIIMLSAIVILVPKPIILIVQNKKFVVCRSVSCSASSSIPFSTVITVMLYDRASICKFTEIFFCDLPKIFVRSFHYTPLFQR